MLFGTLPFFARTLGEEGLAPPAIAFYRFVFTALVLLPFLKRARASLWGFGGGAAMGLGWIGFVASLDVMSVAQAGVIFMTYPFFAILFGAVLFGERVSGRGLFAAALVVAAAALVAPWREAGGMAGAGDGSGAILGALLLALAAPAAYGLLINLIVRRVSALPALSAVAAIALGAVAGLTPVVLTVEPAALVPATGYGLAVLAVFSVVTAFLPQFTMSVFAPRIGATRTALAGGAELPTMFVVGWIAFGEAVGLVHAMAAGLIIAAIALAPSPPPPPPTFAAPEPRGADSAR